MLLRLAIITTCFLFLTNAHAKEYEISELLEIAEQNSQIKAAEFLAISQQKFANQQKYWNNPEISFDRNSGQSGYSLSQTLPFYGKLENRFAIENSQSKILENRRNNLALFVKGEVFTLLYQYKALQTKIELAQKRIARLGLLDKYLSTIILNSPTKSAQAQITKDRIKLVERDLLKYKNQIYQTWNKANIYLNLATQPTKINISWLNEKTYWGRKFFVDSAIENNLNLKEQKLSIEKSKSELAFAKIEQMPDVNVSANKQSSSSGPSGNNNGSGVGISLSVPLINRNQEKILGAQSKIKSQEFELEFLKNQLINLVNNDLNEFETNLKISQNLPISELDKILTRLTIANSEFKKGTLEFITYIELDSQEYQMVDTILDAQIQLASSYASLMERVGNFTLPKNE